MQLKLEIRLIIDWGLSYSSCTDWFDANDIPRNLCVRYAYNRTMYKPHIYDFEVLAVHGRIALITSIDKFYDDSCYLIDINGLIKE